MTEHKDFAKILRATNGQQVLFFLDDDDGDHVRVMRCVVRFEDYTGTLNIGFDDLSKADHALEKADVAAADKVVSALAGVMEEG